MPLIRRGGAERFERAAVTHLAAVYRFARQLSDEESAQDLVQETYLRAWKYFDSYEPGTNCRAWLFRILRNVWNDRCRRPRDFSLTDLSGAAVSLSQYRGKVVLLDFRQTWCVPCVEAIPHLKALQDKYRAQGLVILGVTDRLDADGVATLRRFAAEYHVNYPLLIDEKGTTAAQYSILGYPHTYLVGRDGRVALDRHGAISEEELERGINEALSRAGG